MMAEYIERAAALSMREPSKSNRYYQTDNLDDVYGQGWDDALCCIERLPVADVVPVVHGQWITKKAAIGKEYTICSVCDFAVYYKMAGGLIPLDIRNAKYCPNCGVRMDGAK